MISVVLGILAIVCYVLSFLVDSLSWILWMGFALGIVAWILGKKQKNKAGKILGIVATIAGIVCIVFALLVTGAVLATASGL